MSEQAESTRKIKYLQVPDCVPERFLPIINGIGDQIRSNTADRRIRTSVAVLSALNQPTRTVQEVVSGMRRLFDMEARDSSDTSDPLVNVLFRAYEGMARIRFQTLRDKLSEQGIEVNAPLWRMMGAQPLWESLRASRTDVAVRKPAAKLRLLVAESIAEAMDLWDRTTLQLGRFLAELSGNGEGRGWRHALIVSIDSGRTGFVSKGGEALDDLRHKLEETQAKTGEKRTLLEVVESRFRENERAEELRPNTLKLELLGNKGVQGLTVPERAS